MPINKEVEAKALLSKEGYLKIVNYFDLNINNQIKQVNYYFDTADMLFQKHKIAFRIRHIQNENKYEMTAKVRQKDGSSIELNQDVTYKDLVMMLNRGILPKGEVKEKIKILISTKKVYNIASLTTYRYEVKFDDGLLAIDENHYSNIIDHEIEFEGESMAECMTALKNLLNTIGIDYVPNKMGKRARAYKATQANKE